MRKIIHIDMDAFFASVEQRDNPSLRGKPVVVGGSPDSRGVVAAASYEARQYGIRSAMPCSQAYRKCPQTIFVRPGFEAYKKVSQQIKEVFSEYTEIIEPLSLDEAYLDVTTNKVNQSSATIIAEEIRSKIYQQTGLTASAGVSYNKFLAKTASDINKPNGIKVILPDEGEAFYFILNLLSDTLNFTLKKLNPIMKERLRLQELSSDTYEQLTAKLSSFCQQQFSNNLKIRILNDDSDKLFIETHNLIAHIPILNGIKPNFSHVSFDTMTQQIDYFSQLFTKNITESSGPIVYLTGFSYAKDTMNINN